MHLALEPAAATAGHEVIADAQIVDHARAMAHAARVMRGLIIDDARQHRSREQEGPLDLVTFATRVEAVADPHTLVRIGDALDELAGVEPDLAEIVELKFFCGFSLGEIATMRGVPERMVQRSWQKGRLYLHHAICSAGPVAKRPHAPGRS